MAKSVTRVREAAAKLGLSVDIVQMPSSTRTAEDAARACGCDVKHIVKSLIFEGADSHALKLLLISGANRVDPALAKEAIGESLNPATPQRVRDETGFAIGGVAPFGHLGPLDTFVDQDLMRLDFCWAAAGAPNAVFRIEPRQLLAATGATVIQATPPQ